MIAIRRSFDKYKREFIFLFFSVFVILVIFSLANNKSPHYILPAIPLLGIILGGCVSILLKQKSKMVILIAAISFLNLTPNFVLVASDYGES